MAEQKLIFEIVLGLDDSWSVSRYASVNRWVKALKRRGDRRATRRAYCKCLSNFLRFLNLTAEENGELGNRYTSRKRRDELFNKVAKGMNPDRLLGLAKREIEEKVQAFCDRYNEEGKARSAHSALNCLRSFFKHNGIGRLELDGYQWRKSRRPEYVPTKEDIYQMADHCDERGRAIILCTFQSGLRNAALRALKYGDIREQLEGDKIPVIIHVDSRLRSRIPEACKEDAEYFTFFGKEATEALREYMQWRIGKYGRIDNDEPLFLPYEAFKFRLGDRRVHASEDSLERLVKRAARRARIKEWKHVRFHSLRKSFRSILDVGYTDGGQMAEDDKEYLMGHRLPSAKEPYHNANVNLLAERYMKLNWGFKSQVTKETKVEMIKTFAKSLGIAEVEVKIQKMKKDQPELDEVEALGKILRRELGIKPLETKTVRYKRKEDDAEDSDGVRYENRVISEDELVRHLNQGWEIVKELNNMKIVIRRVHNNRLL